MNLILGSQSTARRMVFQRAGFVFEVMRANIDEKTIRSDDPKQLTLQLANAKADALVPKISKPSLLITADLVVVCNGKTYEKPETAQHVREFFRSYAVSPAKTVNTIVVTNTATGQRAYATHTATVWFKSIPGEVVEQVIATGDPFTHAGGLNIEHPLLKPFVDHIEGDNDSALGLSIRITKQLLNAAGWRDDC
ncbi:Maf family protein [Candidatus Uhrbacteria bacterium]|nr:Maf family protein [Candidatus Uhrbacteria bacterium]